MGRAPSVISQRRILRLRGGEGETPVSDGVSPHDAYVQRDPFAFSGSGERKPGDEQKPVRASARQHSPVALPIPYTMRSTARNQDSESLSGFVLPPLLPLSPRSLSQVPLVKPLGGFTRTNSYSALNDELLTGDKAGLPPPFPSRFLLPPQHLLPFQHLLSVALLPACRHAAREERERIVQREERAQRGGGEKRERRTEQKNCATRGEG
eukprot:777971-Rhodomonas_salina.1